MSFGCPEDPVTLQTAYDNSTGAPVTVTLDSAGGGVCVDNDGTISAGGTLFCVQDSGTDVLDVETNAVDIGDATKRIFSIDFGNSATGGIGNIQFMPDDFTKTAENLAANTYALQWDSTVTGNVAGGGGVGNDSLFGMVGAVGEYILSDQGNLFSTALLLNQATIISCSGFNSGPAYSMVNQPTVRNIGGGSRTMSQANAVRSQMRVGPNTSGNITLTSHEPFFATAIINATVGTASITTLNYFAAKAPTLTAGGTVGTLHCLDIPNIPAAGITTLRGINSAMGSGVFINHTGAAPSNFGGTVTFNGRVDINNGIALGGGAGATLGTIGGTGPTVAAQAQWVEIDIGGTAHWIPVWT